MKIWKPLTKFYYSDERNEFKYHIDLMLEKEDTIALVINGKTVTMDTPPKGKVYKIHHGMSIETFDE